MSKKIWYNVEIECIKDNPAFILKVGEKDIVARVKSYGLAYGVAMEISKIYGNTVKVTIK